MKPVKTCNVEAANLEQLTKGLAAQDQTLVWVVASSVFGRHRLNAYPAERNVPGSVVASSVEVGYYLGGRWFKFSPAATRRKDKSDRRDWERADRGAGVSDGRPLRRGDLRRWMRARCNPRRAK